MHLTTLSVLLELDAVMSCYVEVYSYFLQAKSAMYTLFVCIERQIFIDAL